VGAGSLAIGARNAGGVFLFAANGFLRPAMDSRIGLKREVYQLQTGISIWAPGSRRAKCGSLYRPFGLFRLRFTHAAGLGTDHIRRFIH
jgi:hypothetical protein